MHNFRVRSASSLFPSQVEGIALPDLGDENINFGEESIVYKHQGATLIAIFVREYDLTTSAVELLYFRNRGHLGAIATFGTFQDTKNHAAGTTHFETIFREWNLPYVYLERPENASTDFNEWVWNNPLQIFYHQPTVLNYDGQYVAFEHPAE